MTQRLLAALLGHWRFARADSQFTTFIISLHEISRAIAAQKWYDFRARLLQGKYKALLATTRHFKFLASHL